MAKQSNIDNLRPGEIVLIPYTPFPDNISLKPRPALVVSGIEFNKTSSTIILAPISSNTQYDDPNEVIIEANNPHFSQTGLKCSSAVRCGSIFACGQGLVLRRLGVAHPDIFNQIKELIKDIL
jgi:mRNA-degrading endonuclease toxin of MazEF toxin-antitoxin module